MFYTSFGFSKFRTMTVRLCFMVLAGLFLASCDESTEDNVDQLQQAKDAIDAGDLRTGNVILKNLLENDPKNAEARLLLGSLYLDTGDPVSTPE